MIKYERLIADDSNNENAKKNYTSMWISTSLPGTAPFQDLVKLS